MLSLGANECINHEVEDWSTKLTGPFDVIIDCAEGVAAWRKAVRSKLLRKGIKRSRFVAVVLVNWEIKMESYWGLVGFLMSPMSRWTRTSYSAGLTPKYTFYMNESTGEKIAEVVKLVEAGKLRIVVDENSPHPLTTEGVRAAFKRLAERKGHGKIVVKID